jgi:hypothetical protein
MYGQSGRGGSQTMQSDPDARDARDEAKTEGQPETATVDKPARKKKH